MTRYLGVATDDMDSNTLRAQLLSQDLSSSGASLVGYDGETVEQALDKAKAFPSYAELRAYSGMAEVIHITNPGIEGFFVETGAVSPVDNGGTLIVDAAGRAWSRIYSGSIDINWFNPSQSLDLTQSFRSAASFVNSLSEVSFTPELRIGTGAFKVTEKITFTTAVSLVGDGGFNTVITWGADAATSGFVFNHTQVRGRPSISGMALERTGLYEGTAVRFYRETPDLNVSQKVRVSDLRIRNNNGGWECGVEGERTTGAWISDYEFVGNGDPVDPTKYYGTGIRIKGLSTTPSVHWTITDAVWSFAYICVDAQNVEGIFVKGFNMVSVDYGVIFTGGTAPTDPAVGRPHLQVGPGHISHRRDGVTIANGQQSFVSEVLFYFMASSTANDSHVKMQNARLNDVSNCIMTYGSALGKGISLEGSSDNIITSNTHQIQGTSAISMDLNSLRNVVGIQNFTSDWTKAKVIINSGSGNVMPGGTSRFALPTTALVTGTNTKLTIGGATTNELGDLRPTADLTRLVIPKSGRYSVSFKAAFSASATGDRAMAMWLNGAQPGYMPEVNYRATSAGFTIITAERSGIYFQAGDYIEIYASQNSGADLNLIASNAQVTYLSS